MTSTPQQAVTLPVNSLQASTSFYVAALQPLNYCLISQVQHKTTTSSSEAIGLGPSNTNRIDVFLSQAGRSAGYSRGGKTAHIVFPAQSRAAVSDCYTAALYAGGRAVAPPKLTKDGVFTAIFNDVDGNKVEVCFCAADSEAASTQEEPATTTVPRSQHSKIIETWRDDVAESVAQSTPPGSYPSGRLSSSAPSLNHSAGARTIYYPISATRQRAPSLDSGKIDGSERQTAQISSTTATPTRDIPGSKAIVKTLLGAAAGAAVAYAVVRNREDSKQKEADFDARMAARDRVKAEARSYAAETVTDEVRCPWETKARSGMTNPRLVDRGSGYYSAASMKGRENPSKLRYRSVTYPQPERHSGFVRELAKVPEYGRRSAMRSASAAEEAPSISSSQRTVKASKPQIKKDSSKIRATSLPSSVPSIPIAPETKPRYEKSRNSRWSSEASIPKTSTRRTSYPSRSASGKQIASASRTALRPAAEPLHGLYSSAAQKPVSESYVRTEVDDADTVVPDDSISCAPTRSRQSHASARGHGGRASQSRRGNMISL